MDGKHRTGRIEVICGSMFSGKSEELVRRLILARIARQEVIAFKHAFDDRYSGTTTLNSHSGQQYPCVAVTSVQQIRDYLGQNGVIHVVAIDEVQFFEDETDRILELIQELADAKVRVIVAGLDTDYQARPWEPVPSLLAIADEVTKLHAICMICGEPALRTQRLINGLPAPAGGPRIFVGGGHDYEARCRAHHEVPVPGIDSLPLFAGISGQS